MRQKTELLNIFAKISYSSKNKMERSNTTTKLIIKPKKHLLDINLSDLWRYRDLIALMVRRDFVAQYKQTILGPLWFFISPLFNVLVYTFIFSTVAGISTDGIPPLLFYLSGLTLWNYFAGTLSGTSNTFTANASIFGKVYFPRLVIPISLTISSMIRFLIQMVLLIAIMIFYFLKGYNFQCNMFTALLPVIFIVTALLSLGCGIIISSLTTKYRDLQQVLGFGIQLWMYVTPIIYPVSIIPERYKFLVLLNPMAPLIEAFKYGLLGIGSVTISAILYSITVTFILLIIGVLLFNKIESTFMDTV